MLRSAPPPPCRRQWRYFLLARTRPARQWRQPGPRCQKDGSPILAQCRDPTIPVFQRYASSKPRGKRGAGPHEGVVVLDLLHGRLGGQGVLDHLRDEHITPFLVDNIHKHHAAPPPAQLRSRGLYDLANALLGRPGCPLPTARQQACAVAVAALWQGSPPGLLPRLHPLMLR